MTGSIETYQRAFAKALSEQGGGPSPSGPTWLQSQVLEQKEACTSCHLGLTDDRFTYARLPYRRHSGHYLDDHSPERFGCTVCHGGVADGLSFAAAGHPLPSEPARRREWEQHYGWHAPGAEGMVPLKWISGRCVVCHSGSDTPRGAEPYHASRALVAEKQCVACHRFGDEPVTKVPRAARLDGLGSKVGGSWLHDYLQDPHGFRPGTAMPAYDFQGDDMQTLSNYLLSLDDSKIGWETDDPAQDVAAVERGMNVVRERNCRTCHDIPGIEDLGFIQQHKIGPSLDRVGEKLNPEWIRNWLENPHAIRPEAAMPRFRWKTGEIEDVTAFLSSLRAEGAAAAPLSSPTPPDGERAAQVATRHGCAACHYITALPLDPPSRTDLTDVGPAVLARLAEAGTSLEKLEGPNGVFHRSAESPRLFAADEPVDDAMTFLSGQVHLSVPEEFRLSTPDQPPIFEPHGPAGGLVQQLRCLSCHTVRGTGGDIGPDLTYAGSKLEHDWLVRFLQSPEPIRPMNRARMPHLGLTAEEAESLADWIVTDLKAPSVEQSEPDLESAFSFVGASKVKSPYGCIACHRIGEVGGAVGPELTHVGSRLRTKWTYNWLRNPQRWIHDVRMPKYDLSDEDLLAITRYLDEQK